MNSQKLKILLLDSKIDDLENVSEWLSLNEYKSFFARDYERAVEILLQESPDIVVTNWMMPKRDGKRLVELIRDFPIIIDFIYIIVLTDRDNRSMMIEAFDAGVNDFLTKPVCDKELIARLKSAATIISLRQGFNKKCDQLLKMSLDLKRLVDSNQKLATTDELTGLSNRREAMFRIKEAWSLGNRYGTDLSCLYIDIDNFKSYNDQYGHDVGDRVLKHIAMILKETTRKNEKIFRIGGEEFLILCQMTGKEEATEAGERIRAAIQDSQFIVKERIFTITASVGVATKDETMQGYDELLIRADRALYRAKGDGRNLVRVS